jgi:RNA polymerase sigma-B factor
MSLLRQWELLEVLMSTLAGTRPLVRLVVWNYDHIDSAVAVALAHLHYTVGSAGLLVFHSGAPPEKLPLDWPRAQLRGLPPTEGLETVDGHTGRRRPRRDLLESVVLAEPGGPVDLLVAGEWPGGHGTCGRGLARVRQGGFLLCPAADGHEHRPHGFERIDPAGRLYRRVGPAPQVPLAEGPGNASGAAGPTLADLHDQAAWVRDHAGLARSLARRFDRRGERGDDLEQVAYLALVKCARRFDPGMGRPFSAFATPCIVGELKRHFRDKVWTVRVPRSVQEMNLAIRDAREALREINNRAPSLPEIATYLGATEEEVLGAMETVANSWATSLDVPSGDGDSETTEIPVTDSGFERTLDRKLLAESAQRLSPTEQAILRRVFFDEKTQRQTAEEFGVSQMQISRIVNRALAKMRESFQTA